MVMEGTDTSNHSMQGNPLGAERAAQLATENQGGASFSRTDGAEFLLSALMPGLGIEGELLHTIIPKNPDANQISDCSKGNCTVNGKRYAKSTDIPGNHPKPLLHADGKPVLGPDGVAIVGPDGIDLEKIAQDARAHKNPFTFVADVLKFRHAREWDFQRKMTDDIPGAGARPIFTKQYQNFANIGVGYIMASLGCSLKEIGFYSEQYLAASGCDYKEKRAKDFPHLAERQYQDYAIGMRLWNERHPQLAANDKP